MAFLTIGPLWSCDKVSASGLECFRFDTGHSIRQKIHHVKWSWCRLNLTSWVELPPSVVRRYKLRCLTRHLTADKNCEVRPEITLMLLQNRMFI
ncbi:hypothetical protein AVEN_57875-1 [Araneus ventricosus]|uniref:Uncharacterized protein n=1 Tax=Araneus ventricosus TaxID=182803 RepID=A0A4Y2L298_ARAVE|nr:hypothetical protein AVEN_57875-1 [Araneus ventricosus]